MSTIRKGLTVIAIATAILLTACEPSTRSTSSPSAAATGLRALNADRSAHGLAPLAANSQLQAKAQAWAEQLARERRLRHSVLTADVPACWRALGENVGYGASIQAVEAAYMTSSPHRANILDRRYTSAGVGVAVEGTRTYTVQVFMSGCR